MALVPRLWLAALLTLLGASIVQAASPAPDKAQEFAERQLLTDVDAIPRLVAEKKIGVEQIPDPHWREDACIACHDGTPTDGNPRVRGKAGVNALCNNCHEVASVHSYIHAVGMVPSAAKSTRMPPSFRQAITRGDGIVTCIACHDLPMQCKKERFAERDLNPLFFRGGPYKTRTGLCYNCHDPSHYERLNPHDQISDEGELNTQVCTVCHKVTPNRREARSINDVSFNVTEDLAKLCTGCHPWRPHPGGGWAVYAQGSSPEGPNHLIQPPEKILRQLKRSEKMKDMVLPLDPATGRIFCATCHNPHERGVQRNARADKGADGFKRLRTSGSGMAICVNCHDK